MARGTRLTLSGFDEEGQIPLAPFFLQSLVFLKLKVWPLQAALQDQVGSSCLNCGMHVEGILTQTGACKLSGFSTTADVCVGSCSRIFD